MSADLDGVRPGTPDDMARQRFVSITQVREGDWMACGSELRRVESVSAGVRSVAFRLAGLLPASLPDDRFVCVVRGDGEPSPTDTIVTVNLPSAPGDWPREQALLKSLRDELKHLHLFLWCVARQQGGHLVVSDAELAEVPQAAELRSWHNGDTMHVGIGPSAEAAG